MSEPNIPRQTYPIAKVLNLSKLQWLLDFTSVSLEEMTEVTLLERFKSLVQKELDIDRILVYFQNDEGEWELLLNEGCARADVEALDVERDLLCFHRNTIVTSRVSGPFKDIDVIIPVLEREKAKAYLLLGDSLGQKIGISPVIKHMEYLQLLAQISYTSIQTYHMIDRRVRAEELRNQVQMAARYQKVLVPAPERMPRMPGLEVKAFYKPIFEMGGDSYDVVQLSESTVGIFIADVSGKGVPAAFVMSYFNAHFRARVNESISLDALVEVLNSCVLESSDDGRFVTAFIARYNTETGLLEYVNAGQNHPFLKYNDTGRVIELGPTTMLLGFEARLPRVSVKRIFIEEDTTLLCYTDGVVEYDGKNGQVETSDALLRKVLARHASPNEIVEEVSSLLDEEIHSGMRSVFDDMTLLSLRFQHKKEVE